MISFKISGVVREKESGVPLPGFFVKAYDKDLLFDDLLGSSQTNNQGAFEIMFGPEDFREFFEARPDIYFKVFRKAGGELIWDSSDAVRWNVGKNSLFEILIPASELMDGSEAKIHLLSEDGMSQERFEVGESLSINLRGLRPVTPYEILVSLSEKELFTSTLITNAKGDLEPTILWPQIGFDNPLTGEVYAIDEAVEKWKGETIIVSIGSRNEKVGSVKFSIDSGVKRPLVVSTDTKGRLVNGIEVEKEPIHISLRNLPFSGAARIYMVSAQQNWNTGDPFVPAMFRNGKLATQEIELKARSEQKLVQFAHPDVLLPGAYDFIVRPLRYGYEEDDDLRILRTDIIGSRRLTGIVIREDFWRAKPVLGGCVNKIPVSGRSIAGTPYFRYTDSFEIGQDIYAALDPGIVDPGNISKMCALYVIPNKTDVQWNANNGLNHLAVLGGNAAVQKIKVQSGCINANKLLVWPNAQQTGLYDIVADFGNNVADASSFAADNAYNTPLDIIDGYFTAGFRVIEDPGTMSDFANTGNWNYDEGVVSGMGLQGTVIVQDEASAYHDPGTFASVNTAVPLRAHVYFPTDSPGITDPAQISGASPNYPMIVIIHGNGHSYTSYDFLLQHFASNGFIAASIHLVSNMKALGRANVFFQHMTVLQTKFGAKLANNIGLLGHSRGGEAVLKVSRLNQQLGSGHNINAVLSLAPTDQYGSEVLGGAWAKPYFVLYGSRDGDMDGQPPYAGYTVPNIGFALYDRANSQRKSMCFVYGATHNGFITANDGGITGPIAVATQKAISKAYMNAFFRQHLKNEPKWEGIFTGEWQPASVSATGVKLYMQYRDTVRRTIDEFEGAVNWQSSTIGGVVSQVNLPANPEEGRMYDYSPTVPGLDPNCPHDTQGLKLRWDNFGDRLDFTIPAGQNNVSGFGVLSFRITQKTGSVHNPTNQSQNLRVALKDLANNERAIRVSAFSEIPFPDPHPFGYTKSAMNTVRIPLTSYTIVCAGQVKVDLQNVVTLSFIFSENATGEIEIDEVEFSN
jgi:hypothetical protein